MSIQSFKPAVWEQALLTKFRGVTVTDMITTKPTRIEGNKAIFNSISGGSVKEYTGAVAYDAVTTTPIELIYDKKLYWAGLLDDVDAVQANGDALLTWAGEKALDLKEAIDTAVLAYIAGKVTAGNSIGTTASKTEITKSEQAYDYIVSLGTLLSKKKVPLSNRFVIASCEFVNLLAKDVRFINNLNILPNGVVQGANINGMSVVVCEEVPANTVLCVHTSGLGYGKQLEKTEALRMETSFSDAVRGLAMYGVKELRTESFAKLIYNINLA